MLGIGGEIKRLILAAKINSHKDQASRLNIFFKNKLGAAFSDGRQYPQIINCLNILYKKNHSDEELSEIVTDGNGDGGFADAIVIKRSSVDFFDFKEGENIGLRDLQKFNKRFQDLVLENNPEKYNTKDCCRIKGQLEKIHGGSYARYNIYFVRKDFVDFNEEIEKEMSCLSDLPGVKVFCLSDNDIVNLLFEQSFLKTWKISKKDNINLLPRSIQRPPRGGYDYLIVNIRLVDLLLLYKQHEKEEKDLFSQNIRIPKKNKKFSLGLKRVIDDYPNNFFFFHNGITITAKKISANAGEFIISEPQVVNGAQTIGNLHKIYGDELSYGEISTAKVLCKIIKADQQLTDLICETSNTQKAVTVEDLRTNDSFQKELELYIESVSNGKYKYIRKKEKAVSGITPIYYARLFQWAYSVFFESPSEAKDAKKKIFEKSDRGYYDSIKDKIKIDISKIIFLCDLGVYIEKKIKQEEDEEKKSFLKHANLHILTAMFKISSLEDVDFNKIYKILNEYFIKETTSNSSLNANKIFTKSQAAWEHLKNKLSL